MMSYDQMTRLRRECSAKLVHGRFHGRAYVLALTPASEPKGETDGEVLEGVGVYVQYA
jgi:hypothetical protein